MNSQKMRLVPPDSVLGAKSPRRTPVVDHYAGNSKFLSKALRIFADDKRVDVTVDLEDGAAVGHERQRALELSELVAANSQRMVGVRIHPLDSPYWLEDLKIFFEKCAKKISHVTIPKVDDEQVVRAALHQISELRLQFGAVSSTDSVSNDSFGVHLIIETPKAICVIDKLASLRGVRGLDFGIMDFVSCFGSAIPKAAMSAPEQFLHPTVLAAKTAVVMAAHRYDLAAAHNVTVQLDPISSARVDAVAAKRLGFTRMWSIHPEQVQEIIDGFAPTADESELARAVLTKAQANNWGPVAVDGVLYDRASYRHLWSLILNSPLCVD